MTESTKNKANSKIERVQLVKRWEGHIVGETFTKAEAEKLGIPEESLRPFTPAESD